MIAGTAHANDSSATLEAGGLVLQKQDGIVMESEQLEISVHHVRVDYVFRNTTSKDIATVVAFPLPEFEEHPDYDIALDTASKNPMKFSVRVDDKTTPYETEIKKDKGLVNVKHYWTQVFPKGKTIRIAHDYEPVTGSFFVPGSQMPASDERDEMKKIYCIEPGLMKWLMEKPMRTGYAVHYVLTTGANWDGPIGKFKLTIDKGAADTKVSLCIDGLKKTGLTTFVLEKKAFTPKDDLRILFVD